jgi:hypothetical protein
MRDCGSFVKRLRQTSRSALWIVGATRVGAAAARTSCGQGFANACGHSTAFHGTACEAPQGASASPPPPLSRNLPRASARAIPASLVKYPG